MDETGHFFFFLVKGTVRVTATSMGLLTLTGQCISPWPHPSPSLISCRHRPRCGWTTKQTWHTLCELTTRRVGSSEFSPSFLTPSVEEMKYLIPVISLSIRHNLRKPSLQTSIRWRRVRRQHPLTASAVLPGRRIIPSWSQQWRCSSRKLWSRKPDRTAFAGYVWDFCGLVSEIDSTVCILTAQTEVLFRLRLNRKAFAQASHC